MTVRKRIEFLGIPVDALTMEETVALIDESIRAGKHIDHGVVNAGKVVAMMKDPSLFDSVVSCDLINADGQSIIWAARFLGQKLPERVAGIDLMQNLLLLAYNKGYKCFFLGARQGVVQKVVDIISRDFGKSLIAGYRNGYFSENEEKMIAREIADSGANILFVAISSPKKEVFLSRNREVLKGINITMGVGGTFDVIAGITKRAPQWMQNVGLEWFYRFLQEPKRMWKRYIISNWRFVWLIFYERIRLWMKHFYNCLNIFI